jgi:hypothetical protein
MPGSRLHSAMPLKLQLHPDPHGLPGQPDSAPDPVRIKPCYLTAKGAAECVICGGRKTQMHLPIGHVGYFCGDCCPACA